MIFWSLDMMMVLINFREMVEFFWYGIEKGVEGMGVRNVRIDG